LTAGTAAYAVGKFVTGPVIDTIGGRKVALPAAFVWTTCSFTDTANCVRAGVSARHVLLHRVHRALHLRVSRVVLHTRVDRKPFRAGCRYSCRERTARVPADFLTLFTRTHARTHAIGWPAVVKITSSWYHSKEFGKAMGFISLSFLFGGTLRSPHAYSGLSGDGSIP
jgi:MFS family permease